MNSSPPSANRCPYCQAIFPDDSMLSHILQCPSRVPLSGSHSTPGFTAQPSERNGQSSPPLKPVGLQERITAALYSRGAGEPIPQPASAPSPSSSGNAAPQVHITPATAAPSSDASSYDPSAEVQQLEHRVRRLEQVLAATQLRVEQQDQQLADVWMALERCRDESSRQMRYLVQRQCQGSPPPLPVAEPPPNRLLSPDNRANAWQRTAAVRSMPLPLTGGRPPNGSSSAAPPPVVFSTTTPSHRQPPLPSRSSASSAVSPSKLSMSAIVHMLQHQSPAVQVRPPPSWGLAEY